MAMLAEPRRKQKWTLNPRGKHWSEDSNKFGQKMLEKMGWSSGKGLGANLDGMTEHIRAHYKNDQAGIGYSTDKQDEQWTEHQEGYNELLQQLQSGETAETITKENELSGKSLELKSKCSRARVHYHKFTRGKDVNKYSTKDLANIFGKKNMEDKSKVEDKVEPDKEESKEEKESASAGAIGSKDTTHGVLTIKGGSISDYFKNKMSGFARKNGHDDENGDSESEGERYVGFGFEVAREKSSTPKKSLESQTWPYEIPAVDRSAVADQDSVTPGKKRKSNYVFENPGLELGDSPEEPERACKRRKSEFAFENPGLDLGSSADPPETKSPKAAEIETDGGSGAKKKRKKKAKEPMPIFNEGFTNEAIDLESREDEETNVNQFELPRSCLGLANDALDLTDESCGKKRVTFNDEVEYETDALRASGKKRKNAAKLDKFEVENDKLKKKKKKSKKTLEVDGVFVNEAMDVDMYSQEAHDNAANERKMERARRKRERTLSSLETIAESPEEESEPTEEAKHSSEVVEPATNDESVIGAVNEELDDLSLDVQKKKKKKKKKKKDAINEMITENEEDNSNIDVSQDIKVIDLTEEIQSPKAAVEKMSRSEIKITGDSTEVTVIADEKEKSKKKKKKRKLESLDEGEKDIEFLQEFEPAVKKIASEVGKEDSKENVPSICENTEISDDKKKRKMRKKDKKIRGDVEEQATVEGDREAEAEKSTETEWKSGAAQVHTEAQNGMLSPWDGKAKRSKKMFKALFARSPVLHFAGSNINEIKGYGVDRE